MSAEEKMTMRAMVDRLKDSWPELVTAKQIEIDTGGIVSAKTLANLRYKGEGPPYDRFLGKILYEREATCEWFLAKSQRWGVSGEDSCLPKEYSQVLGG